MLRPGRFACPAPVRTLILELSLPLSPSDASSITTRVYSQFPRLDLHQLDTQHYGLRAKQSQSQSGETFQGEGSRASLRDGFVCAKSLYAGIFDHERSFGQSHLRGCPGAYGVSAKRSESQSGKHSKGRDLAPCFAMGLFVQNRFTRGYSIVKDRLDRATCVDVPGPVELLRNAANPNLGNIPRGGVSRLPSRWVCLCKIALRPDIRLSKIVWTEPLAWMSRGLSSCRETRRIPIWKTFQRKGCRASLPDGQNRFTRGYSIVKDRLDRATCVDVPGPVELLRNAANPNIGQLQQASARTASRSARIRSGE